MASGLIRDAEVEDTLRQISNPVFSAAGLTPERVRIFVVQDDAINAFVAGGANVFIHTGLLQAMEDPEMLMGVLAHEAGHISGGHLARGAEALKNAQIGMVVGYVLGGAAMIAGGGDAGAAAISGASHINERLLLSFTRANEQAADQAALATLDAMDVSAAGMLRTFEVLRRKERLAGRLDPYAMTHPLSAERVAYVRAHVEQAGTGKAGARAAEPRFARMQAKLYAFLHLPPQTLAKYPERDTSVPARVARAIAYYKKPDAPKALALLQELMKEFPSDPFLYDLKGQIAFESSRIDEAIAAYTRAVTLAPRHPLLLTSLAEAQLAKPGQDAAQKAEEALRLATSLDPENPRSWHLMAGALGRLHKPGEASLALAEEAALGGDAEATRRHARQALAQLPAGSRQQVHAEDLLLLAAQMEARH